MKHQNVTEAFEMLLGELDMALLLTREQAASASREGRYQAAQTLIAEAQQIERFIAEIRAKQRDWAAISGKSETDSPVVSARVARGERTPNEAYRLPILRALVALGGEAEIGDVLERVYAEMKSRLKPADLTPVPSDPHMPRWRNTARWERQAMVYEGLLRADSPHGVWAITEAGRSFLAQHGGPPS